MRFTKFICLSLIALFVISSFSNSCVASDGENDERPVIDIIMDTIFKMRTLVRGMGWTHLEFIPPSFYTVTPQVIDMKYLKSTITFCFTS